MGLFAYRMIGAALFDAGVYEGVEADRSAIGQAIGCVLLSSIAAGIGTADWAGPSLVTILAITSIAMVTWIAWAMLVFQIGARLLPEPETRTSPAELLRTIGFAAAPGILQIFAILPRMREPVFAITWAWMFAASGMAVKHALDYQSTARTFVVCGLAVALCLALAFGAEMIFGPVLS